MKKDFFISVIISTYNSEKYFRNRLENLLSQTIVDKLEIIVVNSGSEQKEDEIIQEFLLNFSNIKYIKTIERETIYKAWNRGIKISSGKYITNANTDDILKNNALEELANVLENNNDVGIVYADQFITNQYFPKFTPSAKLKIQHWDDFTYEKLLQASLCGPQPMWRSSIHFANNIWFNEKLEVAGDYEFACNVALTYKLHHHKKVLGQYYLSPFKENKEYQNEGVSFDETFSIKKIYTQKYFESLSLQQLNKKKNYYYHWSQSSISIFYFWKLFFKVIDPKRRLETREFVVLFSASILKYLGFEKKAFYIAHAYLKNHSSKLIGKFFMQMDANQFIPLVSIIIPTFNRPALLNEALLSLTKQEFKNFEVLVVNNGDEPVDEIVAVYEELINIKILKSPTRGSVSGAKNFGLKNSRGKYIAYLDDDDWYHSKHLMTLVNEIEKGDFLAVYSDAKVELQEKEGGNFVTKECFVEYSRNFNRRYLLIKDYIFTPCVLHHRKCFEIVGFFDEKLTTDEDMDMWIRISKIYPFKHIKEITCSVRRIKKGSSLTRDWNIMYNNAKYLYAKHREEYKYNFIVKLGQLYYLNLRKSRAKKANAFNNYY